MKKLLIALFVLSCTSAMTQKASRFKKANSYYKHLSYVNASKIYEELIGSKFDTPILKERLAMCYYRMGEMQRAEKYFSQFTTDKELDKHWYYFYAQTLKQNGKYAESDVWMTKFHDVFPSDSRGLSYFNDKDYLLNIQKRGKKYTIQNLAVNSPYADFGGYFSVNNDVLFISARKKSSSVYREWMWNGKPFLNLYLAQKDSIYELNNPKYLNRKIKVC